MLTVCEPGWATTIQDLGRRGLAHLGVPRAGMVDPGLGTLANRLVGNPATAAVLETCGGLVVRAERALLVVSTVERVPIPLPAGATYRLPADNERLWHYVAVRGGLEVPPVLGSASCDTLSGIGPTVPASGDRLKIGPDPGTDVTFDVAPVAPLAHVVTVWPGPRSSWVTVDWPVDLAVSEVSRVGVRLTGARLVRHRDTELASEGLVRGAVQVTPSGELVMMLADHPTTGGYPVVAVVDPADVAVVAQHRPGSTLRMRSV